MQETPRLLFVHAHPDDESITNGVTIAHYVSRGAQVQVVTCTLGEEGEVIGDQWAQLAVDHADQLGGYRIGELTAALRALGVNGPTYLGGPGRWRDSGMVGTEPREQTAVRRRRPARGRRRAGRRDPHVAPARRGDLRPQRGLRASRPHPDPRRHDCRRGRGRRSDDYPGSPWQVPKFYWTVIARSAFVAGWEALEPGDMLSEWMIPPPDGDFGDLGFPDDQIDAVIDDPRALPAKITALTAHATQVVVGPTGRALALSNNLALPVIAQEHYILTAGVAGDRDGRGWETDLLAGLDLDGSVSG